MKTIHFNKICAIACICTAIALSACTVNFEDINTNHSTPYENTVTPKELALSLFPRMISLMHSTQENDSQMIEQMVTNQYGGYMVTTNRWNGTNFGPFNPQQNWVATPFETFFVKFYSNYKTVKSVSQSKGYIYAWANIVRVAVMLKVVDMYGPIPYSKFDPKSETTEYDSEHDVYHAMINDLNAALAELVPFAAANPDPDPEIAEVDLIYKGDFAKWIKLANSLKLRMAVRIGLVDTDYAKQVMAEAIAGGCITGNADNANIATGDNPYLKASVAWGDLGTNATLSTYLYGLSDPRRTIYLTGGGSQNLGIRPGINYTGTDKAIYSNSANYSKPNMTATSPMLVFCAAETYFLMAEAVVRGWITGNAQTLYEQGITTSMAHRGATLGGYLTASMSVAGATYTDAARPANSFPSLITEAGNVPISVAWASQTSSEMRIEAIITQKWLANYTLGSEAWADFRRTGYPRLIPVRDNLSSAATGGLVQNPDTDLIGANAVRMVRRLPYPLSEYKNNGDAVRSAVANFLGGSDEMGTELWWAKGRQ